MKNTRRNDAVSEIIGTLLILGITVSLFSVVSLSIFSIQPPTPAPTVNIVCTVDGNKLILEHYGGEPLGLDTKIFLTVCNQSLVQTTAGELLDEKSKADGVWNIGERLVYPFTYDKDYPHAEAQVVDIKTNSCILNADVALPPICDVGIKMTVDNQFPNINDPVVFTINATNYKGNIKATNVQILDILPSGLTYQSNVTSSGSSYNHDTGIWTIDTLMIGNSCYLEITAKCTQTGTPTGDFTQLALLLDGSGSISASNWTTMLTGIAAAVETQSCIPRDGSVELTVIQFADTYDNLSDVVHLEVEPVVINETTFAAVAQTIRTIEQQGGFTPTAAGIYLAADVLSGDLNGYLHGTPWQGCASQNFSKANRQIINMVTDGVPTIAMDQGNYGNYYCDGNNSCSQQSAEHAIQYLINTLQMGDKDEFNIQAIFASPFGFPNVNIPWLKDNIAWPQPGNCAPPFNAGWVYSISGWGDFPYSLEMEFKLLFFGMTNTAVIIPTHNSDYNSLNNKASAVVVPEN